MGTSVARILGLGQLVSKDKACGSCPAQFLPGAEARLPCDPEGRGTPPAGRQPSTEPWSQPTGGTSAGSSPRLF